MSTRNIPNEYNKNFILQYNKNTDIDEKLINTTKEIIDIKDGKGVKQYDNPKVLYNPLYSPSDLIDYGIQSTYSNKMDNCLINDKFDPYLNYLKETGLNNDSSMVKYNVEYINIDSSHRVKEPYNIIEKNFNLEPNPFNFNQNFLEISISDESFYVGQKIIISGLTGLQKTYRYNSQTNIIKFHQDSAFVEFGINGNLVYDLSSYDKIDTQKLFVTIDNIVGNNFTSYIGNIPINLLNKTHQIFLIKDNDISTTDLNKFYIKLPILSDGTQPTTNFNFIINFEHYNCIPINEINANYPINNEHINGYQIIEQITLNKILIKVFPPIAIFTTNDFGSFGGNSINMSTINSVAKGYPYSHTYTIQLPKTYSNIIQARILSSLFPDVFRSFRDSTSKRQNNKLYFQDIDNGNNIAVIELESGTYTDQEFIDKMQKKFLELTRITDSEDSSYDNKFHVFINIERSRDYIEFNNYRKAFLRKSIVAVTPPINPNDSDIGNGAYTLTIFHQNHNIKTVGTKIIFGNFIEHLGISPNDLNKEHEVINIIDVNRYDIFLENINLNQTKNITGGGNASFILVPSLFRFDFSYTDSMGEQIGFRNIGDRYSITNYLTKITNKDPYENEVLFDALKNPKSFLNTSLTFNKNQYIIMACKQLAVFKNTNTPYDFFAKINISSTNENILIDQILSPPVFYYNPIQKLSELSFEFFDPDGNEFDFNNIDHSFILEFTSIDNVPRNTGLNSNSSNVI
jgi:hypothetical protein